MRFEPGRHYTRDEIHATVGGSKQSYLPTRDGRVVCGAFTTDLNPEAPHVVLPGIGPLIESAAATLARQRGPIPVFLKRASGSWEYVGDWLLERLVRDPEEVLARARRAGRPGDVSAVLHFRRVDVTAPSVPAARPAPPAPTRIDPPTARRRETYRGGVRVSPAPSVPGRVAAGSRAASMPAAADVAAPAIVDPIEHYRNTTPAHLRNLSDDVFRNAKHWLRWPKRALHFAPGVVRSKHEGHVYSPAQREQLRAAGISADTRSNGPAILAYRLAGGERPLKAEGRHGWSIHHVYDGQFPAPGRDTTLHAVKDDRWFSEAAGLVAVHPVADGLASEVGYFAWLLRREAWLRFAIDPDGVFPKKA